MECSSQDWSPLPILWDILHAAPSPMSIRVLHTKPAFDILSTSSILMSNFLAIFWKGNKCLHAFDDLSEAGLHLDPSPLAAHAAAVLQVFTRCHGRNWNSSVDFCLETVYHGLSISLSVHVCQALMLVTVLTRDCLWPPQSLFLSWTFLWQLSCRRG